MGFLPDLQRIINLLPKTRQNLLFSATFSPEIQRLANGFMVSPTLIEVARRNATSENIRQVMYTLESEEDKRAAVAHLICSQNLRQVIVFSNTKLGAARLARHLETEGLAATAIHGDKTQPERTKALDAFKEGSVQVLVATDVAARGLDIPDLPCVINYDLPTTPEDYVHRIGRTGRAGAKGTAYSFMIKRHEKVLKDIEKLIGQSFVLEALDGFVAKSEGVSHRHAVRGETGSAAIGRPARQGRSHAEGESHKREGQDRPRRQHSTYRGVRFDDSAPIHRDAEFERLRAKLGQLGGPDHLFSQPYEPSSSVLARDAAEKSAAEKSAAEKLASGASGFPSMRNKTQAPRAALLGGGPKNQA
jgi:superfamily II DNA/RNA helicase